jgi:acyl-homoserine lactone synthase
MRLITIDADNRLVSRDTLHLMFAARKRVFVDIMRWDVPVLAERFEIDQFDDAYARYLVVVGDDGCHLASARLLPANRPGILSTLYPELSDEPLPNDMRTFEITRFCLSPDITSQVRAAARNRLIMALAEHALSRSIDAYVAVTSAAWIDTVLGFGWSARRLGDAKRYGGRRLGALLIEITHDVLHRLALKGICDVAPPIATAAEAA